MYLIGVHTPNAPNVNTM